MTMHKNASIRRGSRQIRVDVDVDVYVPITGPEASNPQWSGELLPPNNIGLSLNETYILELPSGPSAKIRITGEADEEGKVPFDGVGEHPTQHVSSA